MQGTRYVEENYPEVEIDLGNTCGIDDQVMYGI
jgi:hypothetical protein